VTRAGVAWLPGFVAAGILTLSTIVAGCGGPVDTTPLPATPSPSPAVNLSVPALAFIATGAGNAQTVSASQAGFSGSFTAATAASGQAGSCSGVATIAAAGTNSFTVTPSGSGACTFTITGAGGMTASLGITVTVTVFGGI
jgi:hypothetical protein